jgi:hypothetical protein
VEERVGVVPTVDEMTHVYSLSGCSCGNTQPLDWL